MLGPTAARSLVPKVSPVVGVERCTAALEALAPDAAWQQRAAYLRSRAKFRLAAKQHREAMADLEAIGVIARPDIAYTRSFGVSLLMLRAVAHLEAGRRDEAAAAAFDAMKLRPWSQRVASFAYAISSLRTKIPSGEAGLWNRSVQLEPDFIEKRAILLARAGDWAEAVADWQRAKPGPGEIGQSYVNVPNVRVEGAPGFPVKGVNVPRTAEAAVAAAMAGRSDLANNWLQQARNGLNGPHETTPLERTFKISIDPKEQIGELEKWLPLVDAANAAGKGDIEAAAGKVAMTTIPFSQTTLAALRTIVGKLPTGKHQALRSILISVEEQYELDRNEHYVSKFDPDKLLDELPDHEEVMLSNPYRSAVKFLKANGFSAKIAKDGKSARVSFFGNKSRPFAIGEMALLRAAELTQSQGKSAFLITNTNAYAHSSTMTMYGVEVGPTTLAGYSTNLDIEFVEPADIIGSAAGGSERLILAADVQSALAPIYIKEVPEKN